jgi:hypothetical protein
VASALIVVKAKRARMNKFFMLLLVIGVVL